MIAAIHFKMNRKLGVRLAYLAGKSQNHITAIRPMKHPIICQSPLIASIGSSPWFIMQSGPNKCFKKSGAGDRRFLKIACVEKRAGNNAKKQEFPKFVRQPR
jgi:hypothetical protein